MLILKNILHTRRSIQAVFKKAILVSSTDGNCLFSSRLYLSTVVIFGGRSSGRKAFWSNLAEAWKDTRNSTKLTSWAAGGKEKWDESMTESQGVKKEESTLCLLINLRVPLESLELRNRKFWPIINYYNHSKCLPNLGWIFLLVYCTVFYFTLLSVFFNCCDLYNYELQI